MPTYYKFIFKPLLYKRFPVDPAKYFMALSSQSTSGRLLLLSIILFAESTSDPKCYYRPDFFLIFFKHFQS